MANALRKLKRWSIATYLVTLHLVVGYLLFDKIYPNTRLVWTTEISSITDPTENQPAPTPLPVPEILAEPPPANVNSQQPEVLLNSTPFSSLMIPVAGVTRNELRDTFTDARSNGRTHDAIDIPAPQGTPVVAVADGRIAKFFDSEAGGTTIYQISSDEKLVYYYAHLQKRADMVRENDLVKQGTIIGYVGDTGNAVPGNFHLHFSIAAINDPKRYWEGTYFNPYPLLTDGTPR